MNLFGLVTLPLGFVMFFLGGRLAKRTFSRKATILFTVFLVVLSAPAFIYAAYYLKILGEPIWLYRLRTITGSEWLASLSGFLAGWVQIRRMPHLQVSRLGQFCLIPGLLALGLMIPHLKPLLRRLPLEGVPEQWRGEVCIQSTSSTCGPASAATILRKLGIMTTERELAAESFTSASGTENWYLARALRRRGVRTLFTYDSPEKTRLPAIAGVRLKKMENSGHFVAILDRTTNQLVVADPMKWMSTNSIEELREDYEFTGFFLVVEKGRQ